MTKQHLFVLCMITFDLYTVYSHLILYTKYGNIKFYSTKVILWETRPCFVSSYKLIDYYLLLSVDKNQLVIFTPVFFLLHVLDSNLKS